jgi:hypothetical protein
LQSNREGIVKTLFFPRLVSMVLLLYLTLRLIVIRLRGLQILLSPSLLLAQCMC